MQEAIYSAHLLSIDADANLFHLAVFVDFVMDREEHRWDKVVAEDGVNDSRLLVRRPDDPTLVFGLEIDKIAGNLLL